MMCLPRVVWRPLGLAVAAGSMAACRAEVVVVAEEPHGPNGGGQLCLSAADCLADELCAKPACDAQQGQCQLRPPVCDNTMQAVCGCDGVTYWNDCLRQRDGVVASAPGACVTYFAPCGEADGGGGEDAGPRCPEVDAVCGQLLTGPARRDGGCTSVPGVCWVLPDSCPEGTLGPKWQMCGAVAEPCVDLCTALLSQQPYQRSTDASCL